MRVGDGYYRRLLQAAESYYTQITCFEREASLLQCLGIGFDPIHAFLHELGYCVFVLQPEERCDVVLVRSWYFRGQVDAGAGRQGVGERHRRDEELVLRDDPAVVVPFGHVGEERREAPGRH